MGGIGGSGVLGGSGVGTGRRAGAPVELMPVVGAGAVDGGAPGDGAVVRGSAGRSGAAVPERV